MKHLFVFKVKPPKIWATEKSVRKGGIREAPAYHMGAVDKQLELIGILYIMAELFKISTIAGLMKIVL